MKACSLTVALAAILAVPACGPDANRQDSGTVVGAIAGGVIGNQFGKGGGRVASTLAGAVVGGIVGNEIGRSLDQRDRELARQAEFDAWERGPAGRPVQWRNPDNGRYGEVIPEAPYRRGSADCRDFVHRVYIDGRPQAMRGTACRNPDGTWTQVG
jgi:surface antigen